MVFQFFNDNHLLLLLILFVVSKRICSMSACFILLHPFALIFGKVYLHSCASLTIFQIFFFTLSLGTSFAFHLISSLHLNKLVDLVDLSSLGCVYGKTWYALCASYIERPCWRSLILVLSSPKNIFLGHTHLSSVEQVFICRSLFLLLNIWSLYLFC